MGGPEEAAEWGHGSGEAEGVRNLVYQTKSGSYVREVSWGWKFCDCLQVLAAGFDGGVGYVKPSELHLVLGKPELGRIESNAPINIMPHLPPMGQGVGRGGDLT